MRVAEECLLQLEIFFFQLLKRDTIYSHTKVDIYKSAIVSTIFYYQKLLVIMHRYFCIVRQNKYISAVILRYDLEEVEYIWLMINNLYTLALITTLLCGIY